MNKHEEVNYKYGRSLGNRIEYLVQDIQNSDEMENYPELISFIEIYFSTIGSSFDIKPNNQKITEKNENALTEINKIFFKKYKLYIWNTYENGSFKKY